jgi:hypothetical protein
MDTLTAFSVIALAALIHASFQLGVSMITLLSGHAIGKKIAAKRTLRLVGAFLVGTLIMTALIVSSLSYAASVFFGHSVTRMAWGTLASAMIIIGLVVWVCYYRRGPGTLLWVPRNLAKFLSKRIHATQMSAEAFSLGLTSVFMELLFIITPAVAAAFAIIALPTNLQLAGVATYVVLASLSMLAVTAFIGSGHNISSLQRWRETNKRFLQFAGGSALIILAFYLYVNVVITPVVVARAG